MIKVRCVVESSLFNRQDYIALGLTCVDICTILKQGMNGKELDELNQPVREVVKRLGK